MTLRDHFEKSGAWLFRWRTYLPILLFAIVLIGMRDFDYPAELDRDHTGWGLLCLGVGFIGLIVRSVAVGYAALGTSGRITQKQEADELNTTGLYATVRHPLYLGNYLMWISVALLTRTVWVPVVITLIFWIYYERIMAAEEAFLRGKFGAVFEAWAAQTPAFIPAFARWTTPKYPFNLRRVLRRERSTLLSWILSFAAFDFMVGSIARGTLHLDRIWIILTGATLLYYAVMYVEKRNARRKAAVREAAN